MHRKNTITGTLVFLLAGSLLWHYNTMRSYQEQHHKNILELSSAMDTLVKVFDYEEKHTFKYSSRLFELLEAESAVSLLLQKEYDFELESDSIEIVLEMHIENVGRLENVMEQINKVGQDLGSHLKD